jgi:hypothetical protein
MQRFTTKIMPLVPRKTYRSVLLKGTNPDFGRITGKAEVIPGQKSAWRKCSAIERHLRSDSPRGPFLANQ